MNGIDLAKVRSCVSSFERLMRIPDLDMNPNEALSVGWALFLTVFVANLKRWPTDYAHTQQELGRTMQNFQMALAEPTADACCARILAFSEESQFKYTDAHVAG